MMIAFTKRRKLWYLIALIIIIPGIISMCVQGFNLGIDFTGGTILEVRFENEADMSAIRELVSAHVEQTPTIQAGENNLYTIRTVEMTESESDELVRTLQEQIGALTVEKENFIGPVVGKELVRNAEIAVLIAMVLMLVYITIRFKLEYALAAILALAHDVLVTLSIFSLFQIELDSAFIAAILTVLGYSINNTIVVFDRIRENSKDPQYKKYTDAEMIDTSISQTLGRSINTVLAVLFLLVSLFLFGGATTRIFTFALITGVAAGFYSSLLLAGSFVLEIRNIRNRPKAKPDVAAAKK